MTNQPTILVKRADGSSVRMTLDEVKKLRSGKGPAQSGPVATVKKDPSQKGPAPQDTTPADKKRPAAPARPNPVSNQVAPRSVITPKAAPDDFSSPLEELEEENTPALPRVSLGREREVEGIVSRVRFAVPTDLKNRFRTIVQLFLKDVRTEKETNDALTRAALSGGMGLNKGEAAEVIKLCQAAKLASTELASPNPPPLKTSVVRPDTKRNGKNNFASASPALPSVYHEPGVPANTTPFNSFVHAPSAPAHPAPVPLSAVNSQMSVGRPTLRLSSAPPAARPPLHDIMPPNPTEIGPVEEIRSLTVTDFKRLSPKPAEAALRLKQKFVNLRDESILLYLDGLSAWRHSPLYGAYTEAAAKAIAEGRKLTAPAIEQSALALAEIQALISMEKELNMI